MNNRLATQLLTASLLVATACVGQPGWAQDNPDLEPLQELAPNVVLPGNLQIGGAIVLGDGQALGGARSVSISSQNGVTTIRVMDNQKNYVFVESEDGIELEYVDSFGNADRERLKSEHPDLFMHAMAFPETSAGFEVELVINVKKKTSVKNADELAEKHPKLFEVYEGARNPQAGFLNLGLPQIKIQGGEGNLEIKLPPGKLPLPLPGDPIPAVIQKGAEEKLEKDEKGM